MKLKNPPRKFVKNKNVHTDYSIYKSNLLRFPLQQETYGYNIPQYLNTEIF
jgi:hypothetical protein